MKYLKSSSWCLNLSETTILLVCIEFKAIACLEA